MMAHVQSSEQSGWDLSFSSYGRKIGLWVTDQLPPQDVLPLLPPGWSAEPRVRVEREFRVEAIGPDERARTSGQFRLFMDGNLHWMPIHAEEALDVLETLIQSYVAEFAHPYIFVHAGVVGWGDGAIVLPGRSFSGKSTLVTALVNAGADYYSDEYAVIDECGWVHPYPRRIGLREGPFGPSVRFAVPVARSEPLAVRKVLFTTYRAGSRWTCEELDHGSAILALCEHTVAIRRRPADALTRLGMVSSSAKTYSGVRGNFEEAVEFLLGKSVAGEA